MSLNPRTSPQLYAVVSRTAEQPAHRRNITEIRTQKLAELKAKKAVDRANALLDTLEARAAGYDRQMKALQRRKQLAGERAERIKDRIVATLEAAALTRADGFSRAVLTVPSPEAVEITDARAIPAEYLRTPKTPAAAPDKVAIKAALQAAKPVPGARLVQGVTLRRV